MTQRLFPFIVALFVMCQPVRIWADNPETEIFSTEAEKLQLIEQAVRPWQEVKRWLIEYEAAPTNTNSESSPVHKVMAVSEPDELYKITAHFPPSHPWQVDPISQEFFIHQ